MEENIGGNATMTQDESTQKVAETPQTDAPPSDVPADGQAQTGEGAPQDTGDQSKKTPAELKAEKFAKEPDKFICLDDVVMAVVKTPAGGYGTFLGAFKRFEMEIALTRVTYKTMNMFMHMDMQRELEQEANRRVIVKNAPLPPNEFAKRMKR